MEPEEEEEETMNGRNITKHDGRGISKVAGALLRRFRRCAPRPQADVRGFRATIPPGSMLGLQFGSRASATAVATTYVSAIHPESVLAGKVQVGDGLVLIDDLDVRRMDFEEVNELLQSRQDEERVISFAPRVHHAQAVTIDGDDGHQDNGACPQGSRNQEINPAYPKILLNGMYTSCHQLDLIMERHDDVVIIAGGAGIVTYISLISTIRRMAAKSRIPCVRTIVPPSRKTLGLQLRSHPRTAPATTGEHTFGPLSYVSAIHPESALAGKVCVGDGVLSIDGIDVSKKGFEEVNELLKSRQEVERVILFAPLANRKQALLEAPANDEELQGNNGGDDHNEHVSLYRTKRIQVHWMCRDEGLIQYVVQNYFDPASHHSDCHGSNNGSASMFIKLIVHHTRPPPTCERSSTESTLDENDADSSSDGSSDQLVSIPVPSHASSNVAATPISLYEYDNPDWKQTLLPSVTFASIVFGGMWIIQYCSDNVNQGRQGIENRLAPVLGILAWSLGISILSFATTKIGDLFFFKLFAYSRLDSGMNTSDVEDSNVRFRMDLLEEDDEENGTGDSASHYNSLDDVQHQGPTKSPQDVLKVLHLQGRPDMTNVIKEAVLLQKRLDVDGSLGLFVCGPNSMNKAVGQAIGTIKKENVYLYQEVFEF